jgi:hypothetical protein
MLRLPLEKSEPGAHKQNGSRTVRFSVNLGHINKTGREHLAFQRIRSTVTKLVANTWLSSESVAQ